MPKLSRGGWIVLVVAALAGAPAAANEIVDPLPAKGETIFIPAAPFLKQLDTQPEFLETLVERLRNFKRYMRRQIEQLEVALGEEEEVPIIPEHDSAGREEARLAAQRLVADALGPENVGELAAAPDPRTLPESRSIGVHDAPLLGEAPEGGIATSSPTSGSGGGTPNPFLAPAPAPSRWDPIIFALDALRWLRREPLVMALLVGGLALFAWARHAPAGRD
jgi:hypothetical protein